MKKQVSIISIGLILALGCVATLSSCKEKTFNIKFNTDGGTTYSNISAISGDVVQLPVPEKAGHVFASWYDNKDFTGEPLSENYMVTGNVTLYAKWIEADVSISFVSNGGTTYADVYALSGDIINLPTPEKDGYLFTAWFTNEDLSGHGYLGSIVADQDLTLYAKYSSKEGTISFVSNGGTNYESISGSGKYVALPVPEKESFVFGGWYANANFTGEKYEGQILLDGSLTLYAKWLDENPVVLFETFDGTTEDEMIYYGEALNLPTPFKYGYSFEGWYTNSSFEGEAIEGAYSPENSITLYAKWSKCTYVYMYYGPTEDTLRLEYKNGDIITVDELYELLTPESYEVVDSWGKTHTIPFDHWAFEGETEDSAIEVSEDIVVGEEEIILVAQYDKSKLPAKAYLTYDSYDNSYTTTGNVAHVLYDEGTNYGIMSCTVSFTKGSGNGAVGPALKMDMPNTDYQYEKGSSYLSVGIGATSGNLQVGKITNGSFSQAEGSLVYFNSMPQSWQDWFGSVETGTQAKFSYKVVCELDYMKVYMSYGDTVDQLVYTIAQSKISAYTGTGFGIRSSTKGTIITDVSYEPLYKLNLVSKYDDKSSTYCYADDFDSLTVSSSEVMFEDENDKNTAYFYKFVGWSLQENGTPITEINGNDTLYALYEKTQLHTVAFDSDNGDDIKYYYYQDNEELTLPSYTPEKNGVDNGNGLFTGYSFNSWKNGSETIQVGSKVTQDMLFTATYDVSNAYLVKFETEGVNVENLIIAENSTFSLPIPEREGYRFNGWYADASFETAYDEDTPISSSLTLYGQWIEQVNVKFISDGNEVLNSNVDINSIITLPSNPTKANTTKSNGNVVTYTFAGWFLADGTTQITNASSASSNVVAYAKFKETETRRSALVTYDSNNIESYYFNTTGNQGFCLPSEYSGLSGEISYDITFNKVKGNSVEVRNMLLLDMGNSSVNVDGGTDQANIFFTLQSKTGWINLAYKIYGTYVSIKTFNISDLKDCDFKTYFNGLSANSQATFNVKIQYGYKTDGTFWAKYYVQNSLLIAYGLTQTELGDEEVYGGIVTTTDSRFLTYVNTTAVENNIDEVGLNIWHSTAAIGGMSVSNFKKTTLVNQY